jgi:hypothetical protein
MMSGGRELAQAARLHLVEVSPELRRLQHDALGCTGAILQSEVRALYCSCIWTVRMQELNRSHGGGTALPGNLMTFVYGLLRTHIHIVGIGNINACDAHVACDSSDA